jgi:hypothetical protein
MNNDAWMSIHIAFKVSLLACVLLLCCFGRITSGAVSHAISSKCPSHVQHCLSTPTPISAPTSLATQPPQIHPYPTRMVQPASTSMAGTPPPATQASAPAISGIVTSHQMTMPRTDAPAAQGTRDQGRTTFLISLAVSTPIFLLSGALLWLVWRRQTNQRQLVQRGISRTTQTAGWMSSHEIEPTLALPAVPVRPPTLTDDPQLAETMQQAQMGLFVLSGRERSLQASSHHV